MKPAAFDYLRADNPQQVVQHLANPQAITDGTLRDLPVHVKAQAQATLVG